jgi:catechol 2,3-dioxygenase-like lactoylglutathione lyase family enzyme
MALDLRGVCPLFMVYDMPTSLRFYRDVLGFEVVSTSPKIREDYFHWVWLKHGSAEIMLNTAFESDEERPAERDPARTAAHEDSCLYFACPDVHAAYEEFRRKGAPVEEPKVAPYGMTQLVLRDPDGYALCFQWPAKS